MTKKILFTNISWQTLYQVLANGLGLVFNIVLARSVSQFEFGVYSYIFSVMAIVSLFLELGIPVHFLRKWSVSLENFERDLSLFISTRVLLVIPVSIFLLGYVVLIDRFVSLEFLLAYVYILCDILVQPFRLLFTSKNHFERTFTIDGIERCISLGGGLILLWVGAPLRFVLTVFIIGRLASLLLSLLLARTLPRLTLQLQASLHLIKASLPLFIVSVFSTLYFRIDTVLIRYLLGVEPVGIYAAAYRLLDASALLPSIVTTATLPLTVHLFANNSLETLKLLLNRIMQGLTVIAVMVAMGGTLYGQEVILLIFGETFRPAIGVLQILSWNAIFLFLTYPLSHFLVANHQEHKYLRVLAILLIFNVIANFVMIPRYGLNGSALTTVTTEALSFVLLIRFSHVRVEIMPLLWITLLGVMTGILIAFFPFTWYINVTLHTILFALLLVMTNMIQPRALIAFFRP